VVASIPGIVARKRHPGHCMVGSHGRVLVGMLFRRRHILVVHGSTAPMATGGKDI
jgi:hypothetical protein